MHRRADARADAALGAYTYVDLAGATQGPFAARALARWHEDGFLERALALRRDGDGRETTVGDVVDALRARDRARDEEDDDADDARARENDGAVDDVADDDRDDAGARRDDARASALDDRLSRLLAIGGGELPRARAVTPDVADEGGCEDAAARETMGSETVGDDARARAYRRPRGWRDILRATRERVRRGRAAMGEPLGEEDETGTWSAAVNARLRDPRPDGRARGTEPDEEGALPEEPAPIDLREPFWVIEDRARMDGELDAERLNAAVAEQLRNTSKPPASGDARSDDSDVSWSGKPGGLERQAARAAERAALEAAQRNAREAAARTERAEDAAAVEEDEAARARAATEEARRRRHEMEQYFAANPYAGEWWLTEQENDGKFTLGPFAYHELLERLPHVAVAHRRDDDAWRVVGPYAARERVEGYGRNMDGAVLSFDRDEADADAAASRDMETEAWFDVVTSVIDVEGEVQNALSRNVGDEKDVNAWFDREMSKVKLPPGIAPMKSVKSTQRKRRRGFETRVVANETQNLASARVLGDLYQAVTRNRKRLFAAIIEPVLDEWERE